MKKIIHDLSYDEISQLIKDYNQPSYRALQLYKYLNEFKDLEQMFNLPKEFREQLKNDFIIMPLSEVEALKSKDGSKKYLFKLSDGMLIESVFMPHEYGNSVCVSTQAGCRMGCVFCASGKDGLARNLSAGEILAQVLYINSANSQNNARAVDKLVLMGSGEPLDNYDNVKKFLDLVNDNRGINIGMRSISLSTCGLKEKIYKLADDGFSGTLSISLHASNDETRKKLMKSSNANSINEIITAAKYFFQKTGRRVIFEYSLIDKVNDSFNDAAELAKLIKGICAHVNLIILNPTENSSLKPTPKSNAYAFLEELKKYNISATLRKSMGSDVAGACGQLRNQYVGRKDPVSSPKKP